MTFSSSRKIQTDNGLRAPAVLRVVVGLKPRRGDERCSLAEWALPIKVSFDDVVLVACAERISPNLLAGFGRDPALRRAPALASMLR
jgi:hypothetical protein